MREGWELKKLGEVCEKITRGISPRYIDQNGTIVVNQKCVRDHKINFDLARLHDENTKSISVDKFLRVGDVLVNSTGEGTLGRVAQVRDLPEEKVTVDSHVSIVRPIGNQFYLDFFGWAMIYIESEIEESGAGASGQTELARTVLENNFSIAYPKSLPEQQRIVAILDEAFAAIAKAKANAEQNLKNAKELFESYLQGVFESSNYGNLEFGKICELVGGSQPSKEQFIYEPLEGYIRLIQVRDYRTEKFITYIPKSSAKRFCNKDDIMIGRYGPPIFGIFKGLEGAYNVALIKAIVNESLCDKDYFYWFLKNTKLREFVEQSSKRAVGQDGIRKELLEKYPVPLPPLPEQ